MEFLKRTDKHPIMRPFITGKKFLCGLLVIAYSCLAAGIPTEADLQQNRLWQEALTLIDKGQRTRAAIKLETLLKTNPPESDKLKIHHALAYNYEKLQKRPNAVRHYARVATLNYPLADCAIYRLAQIYKDMDNKERAIKWYKHLINDYPTSFYRPKAKWTLAQLHLEQNRYATAKPLLTALVKLPEYARPATFALARCHQELGDPTTAFETYRKLIDEQHTDSTAEKALSQLKQLARTQKALRLTPTDQLNCGIVFFSNKQWKTAITELELIPRNTNLNLRAHALYLIGQCYQERKQYDTAIQKFNTVITLGKQNAYISPATYQIAHSYLQKDHLNTAISQLADFVNTHPTDPLADDALYTIAQIREKQEKPELAMQAYQRLVKLAPQSPYVDIASWRTGWQHFDEQRYEESYRAFKTLKENFPGNRYAMGAHFWMAKIRERQNKHAHARELYKEVAEQRHWYYGPRAKAILGITCSQLEPKAIQDAKLPKHQPQPPQIPTLMELRLYEDAVQQLDRHINTVPIPAQQTFHNLIKGYEGLAMYDKARKVTEKLLKNPIFANATCADLTKTRQKLYPRYYATTIEKYAKMYNVDPFFVYAMILEESRYNAEAISWAGAIGLMQIMPATGRDLAQQIKIPRFRTSMLKQPDVNIHMGTKYMGYLNTLFDNNPMFVTGAYNGGPARMERWIQTKNITDIDEFVEKITIRETRLHIKKVIDSYDNYVEIYGETDEPPALKSTTSTE